jgi:hypothetical protein
MTQSVTTPVVFFIFNRPETTRRVFEAIRSARPSRLLVIADGPRKDRLGEADICATVRNITEAVDWPCEVVRNYSSENMGCKKRLSSGLNWVFEQVEEAIILEDDCLPHPDFFHFAQEMLTRYRHDTRIGQICGANFQLGWRRDQSSYYFSRYHHIWGWATWRRSWQEYDLAMSAWPHVRDGNRLYDYLGDPLVFHYWAKKFDQTYTGRIETWDYQWMFAMWINNRLSIIPNVNLITNIGVQGRSGNGDAKQSMLNIPFGSMEFPLRHPGVFIRDALSDSRFEIFNRKMNVRESFHKNILRKIRYKFKFRY